MSVISAAWSRRQERVNSRPAWVVRSCFNDGGERDYVSTDIILVFIHKLTERTGTLLCSDLIEGQYALSV